MSIIEFKNVDIIRNDLKILDNISFSINENTAIIGENGSGKSTILSAIYRDIYPIKKEDSYIEVMGEKSWNIFELRNKVGVIVSDIYAFRTFNINVMDFILSGYFNQVSVFSYNKITNKMKKRMLEVCSFLSIEYLLKREICNLSTGEFKRCQIARVMVHDPDNYIFDEPTSGLDIGSKRRFMKLMKNIISDNKKVFLVTHHISEILPSIKRVIGIKQGKILFDGERDIVINDENISKLFDTSLKIGKTFDDSMYII